MELVFSALAGLFWIAVLAILALCAYWYWRAVLEGSRRERLLLVGGALCVVAASLLPASIGGYRRGEPVSVLITADWILWVARGLAAAAFIAVAISSRLGRRRRGLQAALLTLVVFGPVSECARFASDPAPWHRYSVLDHPNGVRYAFIESSFMQGQLMSLARIEAQRWYGTEYAGLVSTNGDSPRYYASLVRPDTQVEAHYGQLHLLTDGRVVALRSRNQAYMAFDPATSKQWAHEAIYELSPFIMLDAQAKPLERDVKSITDQIADIGRRYTGDHAWLSEALEQGHISGIPAPRHLESALEHPNPAVRKTAEQLLTNLREQQRLAALPAASGQP